MKVTLYPSDWNFSSTCRGVSTTPWSATLMILSLTLLTPDASFSSTVTMISPFIIAASWMTSSCRRCSI